MAAKRPEIEKYNLTWPFDIDPAMMEMEMIRHGGRWKKKNGKLAGEGIDFHFRQLIKALWPWLVWHHWVELQVDCYLKYRIIGQIGAASTGKSFIPAACVLADYYCFPNSTTVMVSSTTRESLEMRVWGEIKKLHKSAKEYHPWLPGYLIEGRQRVVSDPKNEAAEGRDFRNGLVGVACKRGQMFQGIEEFVGIKNKHLRLLADEGQFMPRSFVDSISNLNKNTDFKCVMSGNPKDTTDGLGVLCEPAAQLGGWDIKSDGKVTATNLVTSAVKWVDMNINYAFSASGPTAPSLTSVTNPASGSLIQQLAFDNGDELFGQCQLPHTLAITNASFPKFYTEPHVHFDCIKSGVPSATASNVTWRIEWEWGNINGGWVRGTNQATMGITNNFTHYVLDLGHITNDPPMNISAVFRCRLTRPASALREYDPTPNSHTVILDAFDLHVPVGNQNAIGSSTDVAP